MKTRKQTSIIFVVLLVVGLIVIIALSRRHQTIVPVNVSPPANLPTFMLTDDHIYRQDDARWADETIGETDDTLYAYGCTIASVAMAASNLTGQSISPKNLEENLSSHDGFTDRGWLIWDKVSKATDGAVTAKYYDQPSHTDIKTCMNNNGYPVVKIKLGGTVIHWALIVGTTKEDYLIRDPLVGTIDDPPIKLTSRSDQIYGVRCIELSEE